MEDRRISFFITMILYIAQTLSSVAVSQMQEWCNAHIAIANTRATLQHIYLLPYSTQEELSHRNISITIENGTEALKLLFANVSTCISILVTIYLYSLIMALDSAWNLPYIAVGISLASLVLIRGLHRLSEIKYSSNIYEKLSDLVGKTLDPSINHDDGKLLSRVEILLDRVHKIIRSRVVLLLRLASTAVLLFVLSAYVMAGRSIDFNSRTSYGYYLNQVLDIYLLLPQFVSLAYNSVIIEMQSTSLEFILSLSKRVVEASIMLPRKWSIEIADLQHNGVILSPFKFLSLECIGLVGDRANVRCLLEIMAGLIEPDSLQLYMNGKLVSGGFSSFRDSTIRVTTTTSLPRGTVEESFEMQNGDTIDKITELLELVELPLSHRTCNVNHLSISERNCLQLARNLLRIDTNNYKIILLDDIDSGLSSDHVERILQRIIQRYSNSSTIFINSCRPKMLQFATRKVNI
jgi:ABC-type iron transport system FetAB ATPase subunit